MEKRDAVKTAINHKTCASLPYAITFARDAYEAYGERLTADFVTGWVKSEYEAGRLDMDEAVRLGIGNSVFAFGCPWWNWYDLPKSYSGYDAPEKLPKTIGIGNYVGFTDRIKAIKDATGCFMLVTIWGSHFEKAYFARGIENFLADMAGEPEFAKALLDMIIRKNIVMLENIVNIPEIDGILLGSDWGSQKSLLMSPDVWHEMIEPGEQREYNLIHEGGKDVWVHSCGNVEAIMGDLVRMGVDVLNPVQPECMELTKIKRLHGDKLTFWGGISTQQTLPYGTPGQVRTEIAQVVGIMGKGGGYILSPAQSIQSDVPYENACAMIDEAQKRYAAEVM